MSLLRSIVSSSRALVSGAKDVARLRQIVSVFVTHGFGWAVAKLRFRRDLQIDLEANSPESAPADEDETGRRLVAALTTLGPTWIKFGQILSTRPDLLPAGVIAQLATLQDQVQDLPFSEIDAQLRKNLGEDYRQNFRSLDERSLASASIAQVHRAVLTTGEDIVLKIQRPAISSSISSDISILHLLAGYAEEAFEEARSMDLRGIVTDFAKSLDQELDYRAELANLRRFARNFEERPSVYFPKVYAELSTSEVLCMEFINGRKLNDVISAQENNDELVQRYFDAAYHMLFIDGFFHGDLHPGNVFLLDDGRLALIDCGMVGQLTPTRRDKVIDILYAVLNEDLEALARAFFSLAIPQGPVDYIAFESEAMSIAERYLGGVPLSQVHIGELFSELVSAATRQRVRMPSDFTMMFKAIATTEGLARSLAPNVDPVELARPFVTQAVAERYSVDRLQQMALSDFQILSSTLRSFPRTVPLLLDTLRQGRFSLGLSDHTTQLYFEQRRLEQNRNLRAGLSIVCILCGTLVVNHASSAVIWGISSLSYIFWGIGAFLAFSLLGGKSPEV